jgi:hypothetical protein
VSDLGKSRLHDLGNSLRKATGLTATVLEGDGEAARLRIVGRTATVTVYCHTRPDEAPGLYFCTQGCTLLGPGGDIPFAVAAVTQRLQATA